uniref:Uncharacterized protein n=1 Tax=Globodera rostochiensis TaxID=31243 RepID=A0A914HBW7_GLORO
MSSSGRLPTKRRRRWKVSTQRLKKEDGTRRVIVTPPSPAPSLLLLWLLCVTSCSPASVPSGHCSQWVNDEIQQCVQPVADFAKTLNKQQQTEESSPSSMPTSEFGQALQWPTKMGGQVFRELCRLINDFELCVDGYRQKCRRHITISLIEASYGFLCNEGFDTFMASAECLMDLDQRPNVKQCHDRTLKSIEEANNDEGGTVATKLNKMCSALNYFSNCVRTPIRQSCGIDAWRVIFRVLKDTTRTLMPQCQFEELNEEKEREEQKGREEENGRGSDWNEKGGRKASESDRRNDWKEEKEVGKGRGDWKEEKEVGKGRGDWKEEKEVGKGRGDWKEEKEVGKGRGDWKEEKEVGEGRGDWKEEKEVGKGRGDWKEEKEVGKGRGDWKEEKEVGKGRGDWKEEKEVGEGRGDWKEEKEVGEGRGDWKEEKKWGREEATGRKRKNGEGRGDWKEEKEVGEGRGDWKEEKEVGKGRGDWKEEKEVGEEKEAKAINGKKDEANGRNRGTARNSVKLTTATAADPFGEWEEWEEDTAVPRPSADDHAELHHQIHYGSQLSRNGASPTEAAPVRTESNFILFVPFLLSVVLFSSAPLYCFTFLSFFVEFR